MLVKTNCHRIITTNASLRVLMNEVKTLKPADWELTIEDAPTVAQCYPHLGHETAADPFTPYPEPATQLDLDTVFLYIHSSGSTGFPKPIASTTRTILSWCCRMFSPYLTTP